MRIPQQHAAWAPDWAHEAIFYHIYPLGFFDAPPVNDGESPPTPRLGEIHRWLDHLQEMGITALYLGPIFESESHGYDTVDYFNIDRRLGDLTLFKELVDMMHARGLRVILDGVFNHTGRSFFAFKDVLDHGQGSQYHTWYNINWGADSSFGDGFAYASWEGHEELPELNLNHADVRDYIYEVARMWLADVGVDGWRLDVAYELPTEFIWNLRRVCKEANANCLLLGELIGGDYRKWVAPDLLDAGTNYQFYESIPRSFNDANMHDLQANMERAWHSEWGVYKDLLLYNFMGNHDVTRILSRLEDERYLFPALVLLFTAPGMPSIYYGDEIGMRGEKEEGDEALRPAMPLPGGAWPDTEGNIYQTIRELAEIRRGHAALQYGRFTALKAAPTVLAYLRQHTRESAIVVLNSSDQPASITMNVSEQGLRSGTRLKDVLNRGSEVQVRDGQIKVEDVPPGWGRILTT